MGKKQNIDLVSKSQEVLEQYIRFVERKGAFPSHHKARILIGKRNNNYNKILEIGTMIETNVSKIIICGDSEFMGDFYAEYTNEYQKFLSYSPGTLIVRDAVDIWGNSIEIDISLYE